MGKDTIGLIVGETITNADEQYKKTIERFIEKQRMENNILFLGFRHDVADILAATDCVVIPSDEGLGLVAMEAMCARTRVVGKERGGTKELFSAADCGEMYSIDGTEHDIAAAILKALNQNDSQLENGYQFCKEQNHDI